MEIEPQRTWEKGINLIINHHLTMVRLYKFIMDLKKLKNEAEFNAELTAEINVLRKKAISNFGTLFYLINKYDSLWITEFNNSYNKLIQEFRTYMKKNGFQLFNKNIENKSSMYDQPSAKYYDVIISLKIEENTKKLFLIRNDECIAEFRLDLPVEEQDYKYFLDIVVDGKKISDFGLYNNIAYQKFTESFTSSSDLNELIDIIDKKINYVQNAIKKIHPYDFCIHTSTGETFKKFEDFFKNIKE